jgi:hypothetical protein
LGDYDGSRIAEIIMTRIIDAQSKWRSVAGYAAGVLLTAALAFGTFTGSAGARERGWEHRDYRHHDWNGGYYRAPPVIYGSPYYYTPPLVYGPGVGLNFNFR